MLAEKANLVVHMNLPCFQLTKFKWLIIIGYRKEITRFLMTKAIRKEDATASFHKKCLSKFQLGLLNKNDKIMQLHMSKPKRFWGLIKSVLFSFTNFPSRMTKFETAVRKKVANYVLWRHLEIQLFTDPLSHHVSHMK